MAIDSLSAATERDAVGMARYTGILTLPSSAGADRQSTSSTGTTWLGNSRTDRSLRWPGTLIRSMNSLSPLSRQASARKSTRMALTSAACGPTASIAYIGMGSRLRVQISDRASDGNWRRCSTNWRES